MIATANSLVSTLPMVGGKSGSNGSAGAGGQGTGASDGASEGQRRTEGGVSFSGAGNWSVYRTNIIGRVPVTVSERKVLASKQLGRFQAKQVAEKTSANIGGSDLEEIEQEECAPESKQEREEGTDETMMDTDGQATHPKLELANEDESPAGVIPVNRRVHAASERPVGGPVNLHIVHNCTTAERGASADPACGCDEICGAQKTADDACMNVPRSSPSPSE